MRLLPTTLALSLLLLAACDSPDPGIDAGPLTDAGRVDSGAPDEDAGPLPTDAGSDAGGEADAGVDAGLMSDAGADAGPMSDAGPEADAGIDGGAIDAGMRTFIFAEFCSGPARGTGLYRGTLGGTNDFGHCGGAPASTPGQDGTVTVRLEPGETVRAVYRHVGDGLIHIQDACGATAPGNCLDESDTSSSGPEEVQYTNNDGVADDVHLVLDSDTFGGPQAFELDIFITP